MPFPFRSSSDTSNPTSPRVFGTQSTFAQLCFWKNDGHYTYAILLLGEGEKLFLGETNSSGFRSEGFFDGIEWYKYKGFLLQPYDATTGTGDYVFHKGYETDPVLGYADPNQGRPVFFPELDFTFSGRAYVEVRLSSTLHDGTSDPTDSEIKLRASCLWDYDVDGNRVGPLPTFSANNARVLAFCARCAGIDVANRFDWPSWVMFRDICNGAIAWELGGGDGLLGEHYSDTAFTTLVSSAIDKLIDFNWGQTTPISTGRPVWTFTGSVIGENASWTKTAVNNWGNAKGISTLNIANGGTGSFGVIVGHGESVVFGLTYSSNPPLLAYSEIAFGWRVDESTGSAQYILGGTPVPFESVSPGDELSFDVAGGAVVFKKNGVALSVPGVPATTGALYAAVTAFYQNAGITSATMNPSPLSGGGGPFSVKWSGYFQAGQTGTHTFYVNSNDGAKLTVNGTVLIDDLTGGNKRERSGSIALTLGQFYTIELRYQNLTGPAEVTLMFSTSTVGKQPIPQIQLFSTLGLTTAGRTIPRFSADMVFNGTSWPQVFDLIMTRCLQIKWQFVNGKIVFLDANTRTPVIDFIYEEGIPFTVDTATDELIMPAHGLSNGDILRLRAPAGILPTGLALRTPYKVANKTTDRFQLTDEYGDLADIHDTGKGTYVYSKFSNIVQASVTAQRTDPTSKPNWMIVGFRNADDEVLKQDWVPVDRPDLRLMALGRLIDNGVVQIGVAHKSEAERCGEALMRRLSDRDIDVQMKGQKDSHVAALHDLARLIHPRGDWRMTEFAGHNGPIEMEIVEETFESTIETANEKSFILKIWSQEHDDTAHGPLRRYSPAGVLSSLAAPPPVTSIILQQRLVYLPDGTAFFAIDGRVQFDVDFPYDQIGRVYWRRPDDESLFTAIPGTDTIMMPAHGFTNNTPIMFRTDGGVLPGAVNGTDLFFAINVTTDTFKVANRVNGPAIDIGPGAGSGNNYCAPFVLSDKTLIPTKPEKQAAFNLNGIRKGIYWVLIVTESALQQKRSMEQHTRASLEVAVPVNTIIKIFDNVQPRDVDQGLGLTIGICRAAGTGIWLGASLERDRGYGYQVIAPTLENEATLGHTDPGHSFLPASAGTLYFIKEGGPNPVNATTGEIDKGKNNYFVGREKLGVQTWTLVSGVWQGTGLVRGLNHTDIFQSSHTAQEDVIQIDENTYFIPIELRDVGQSLSFKVLTFGQQLADVSALAFTPRGDSIRPYAVSNLEVVKDGFGDALIRFVGHPRSDEQPETYTVEVWSDSTRNDPTKLKGTLPVTIGSSHACLLVENLGFTVH
jgi:hypothetical protein